MERYQSGNGIRLSLVCNASCGLLWLNSMSVRHEARR